MRRFFETIRTFIFRFLPWKNKANGDFVRRSRYSLALTNEGKQATVLRLKGSKLGWALGLGSLFAIIGLLWVMAVILTPLRNVLPVKMQTDLRNDYLNLSVRLDSAANAAAANERYLQNLWAILGDSAESVPPTYAQALTQPIPLDSLMESSNSERSFVSRFENSERFNVSVLAPIAAEGMTFYPPVMGLASEEKISDSGIPYAVVAPAKSSPISAIYRGTVVSSYFTTGKGITVIIQHPNDFMSVYSGLADSFVSRGDKVNAGTRIGLARDTRYPFTFELWRNGTPLPPQDYIAF